MSKQMMANQAQLMQKLLDSADVVMSIKDAEGRFLMVNEKLASLFGESKEAIIGKTDYDYQDKEQADSWRANDQQVTQSGKPMAFKEGGQWENSKGSYVSHKFPINDLEGYPNAVGIIAVDITDIKE